MADDGVEVGDKVLHSFRGRRGRGSIRNIGCRRRDSIAIAVGKRCRVLFHGYTIQVEVSKTNFQDLEIARNPSGINRLQLFSKSVNEKVLIHVPDENIPARIERTFESG